MSKYKGIIFDLDGTLIDSLEDLGDSVNEVLDMYGCKGRSYQDYKLMIGNGIRELLAQSFPRGMADGELIGEALLKFAAVYERNYRRKTQPYPGIREMLDALALKGVKLGVNSNKPNDYTKALVKYFFPGTVFAGVYGERAGVPKKPDPQAALEIARAMNLPPGEVIYIGDSKTDIQTGKNARMGTGGVLWGFRDEGELTAHKAGYIFKEPAQIASII